MTQIFTNLFGYAGTITGSFLMAPQVIKSFRTKKSEDVSMATVILYLLNGVFWLTYGVFISAMPVIIANAIALVISIALLILKLKYDPRSV
jgi:MtN3 and saliva related transmembrane protein